MRKVFSVLLILVLFSSGCISGNTNTDTGDIDESIQEQITHDFDGIDQYMFNSSIDLINQSIRADGIINRGQNTMDANYTIDSYQGISRRIWIQAHLRDGVLETKASSAENPESSSTLNKTVDVEGLILENISPMLNSTEKTQEDPVVLEGTPTIEDTSNYLDLRINKLITGEQRIQQEKIEDPHLKVWIEQTNNTSKIKKIELKTQYRNNTISDNTTFTYQ